MKKIISTLLLNSRREHVSEISTIDLNEVIKNQIELFKADQFFKHQVNTKLNLEPLPQIRGIYAHFSQSLGNLIKNAVESMYDSDTKWLLLESYVRTNTIVIQITDTGTGIAKEDLKRIFKPFYTTKPLTASDNRPIGTGLGLSSTKEMIESYGGKLSVKSTVGEGTKFKVMLPSNNPID
jgi:signal transduction histidine kinase